MVDKLIRGRIIEIIIVIFMVLASIPAWKSFQNHISTAEVMKADNINLDFKIRNNSHCEQIVVSNDYPLNKTYKIFLKTNENVNEEESYLKINNTTYELKDFYKTKRGGNYLYTIVMDNISANSKTYFIEPQLAGNSVIYSYIFEENTIF